MDVGELGAGFRFRRVRHDKVAGRASRSVSRASPGTENEGCAFRYVVGVLDPAIEFVGELAESPTWRASCRCLPPSLLRDTLSSRVCR